MEVKGFRKPTYILYVLGAIFALCTISIIAQTQKTTPKENYHRPSPTKPIKPTVPDANRFQEDKVFLEYADSLYRPANEMEEYQIVKGSVKFRQGGMWMFCDSAYYYPTKNSMDAFGHVEMRQGDTLFVYADKLYYDGLTKHATLTHGPSRQDVQLKNRSVTLTTDSLDYDLNSSLGWYVTGGILEDDVNTLTSGYGEYSPSSKLAKFREDVVLVNRKDGYKMFTEELEYNTATHIADINSQTRIEGANDTILTTRGWYNTATDHAQLTSRSTILHRDSNANVITLEGDSIIYDKISRISRAYMFRAPGSRGAPMIITDTARKVQLIGGYGEYNDAEQSAYSTEYPLLIDYSRPDTLFLRADTVLSFLETVKPDTTDTLGLLPKDFKVAKAIGRARFFNTQLQGIADTLIMKEQDSILYMLRKPMVWSEERQIYGNRINVHFNDSTPDWAELPESGMIAQHIDEDFYDQLTGTYMKAFFENQKLKRLEVEGNVKTIMLPEEKDSSYNKLVYSESSYMTLEMDTAQQVERLKMWPEVTGYVAPLFEVKKSQQFIEGFRWFENLRPERSWYGDRLRWVDYLGEVTPELDQYFKSAPLFKQIAKPARGSTQKPNSSSTDQPATPNTPPPTGPAEPESATVE